MSAALRIEPALADPEEFLRRARRLAAGPGSLHEFVRAVESAPEAERPTGRRLTSIDVSEAKTLVQSYARKLRDAEERLTDYEHRFQDLAVHSAAAIGAAQERLDAAQAETRAALARSEAAETRALEAEAMLKNLVTAIEQEFATTANAA